MMARRGTAFGALLEPRGVHVIEYRRESSGIRMIADRAVSGDFDEIEDGARSLAEVIASMDGRGSGVTVAVRGFGVCHRVLTLPPADRSVLRPVVEREMRRLNPEIADPVVDFVVAGQVERRAEEADPRGTVRERRGPEAAPPAEVFAAAVPAQLLTAVTSALDRYDIELEHLTIVPQAMARLYSEANGAPDPTAVAMLLPGGPLFGVFHHGALRFVSEPPGGGVNEPAGEIQTVIDQVTRGRMYLRQRFRGADIGRVFVATDPQQEDHFRAVLATALDVDVLPLISGIGSPGAAAALGAVLDAQADRHAGLALYPPDSVRRERTVRERVRRTTLIATSVAAVAMLWALWSVFTARAEASDLRTARAASAEAVRGLDPVRGVVEERRANAQRVAALHAMITERRRLARQMQALDASTPPAIELNSVVFSRDATGWRGDVTGTASGMSGAHALRILDRYSEELPRALGTTDVQLSDFTQTEADETLVSFRLTFSASPTAAPTP